MKGSSVMLVLLGCLFVLGVSADALYSPKDGVILATDATFNALVLQSNRPSIVEFFAPWCTSPSHPQITDHTARCAREPSLY
jgi:thiol-disulfide isomerase/thioredoxin